MYTSNMEQPQQYYYSTLPPVASNPNGCQYIPADSQGQYIMPLGQPQYIYVPQTAPQPQYYSTAPMPMYYQPEMYLQTQNVHHPHMMTNTQHLPQHQVLHQMATSAPSSSGGGGGVESLLSSADSLTVLAGSGVRPLSTSTPLPPMESLPPPMTNQIPYTNRIHTAQLKYHRSMEHDDMNIENVSAISSSKGCDDGDKTMMVDDTYKHSEMPNQVVSRRASLSIPFNYKTRLCMTYASGRQCEMGSRCRFAHGTEELRTVEVTPRPPNHRYKTKLCNNYVVGGPNMCPYGLRCEFIHPNDKEYRQLQPQLRQSIRHGGNGSGVSTRDADVTPENLKEAPTQTRSATKSVPTKILLKNKIGGSMMSLDTLTRELPGMSISSLDSGKQKAKMMQSLSQLNVPAKFARRRSMSSQMPLNNSMSSSSRGRKE